MALAFDANTPAAGAGSAQTQQVFFQQSLELGELMVVAAVQATALNTPTDTWGSTWFTGLLVPPGGGLPALGIWYARAPLAATNWAVTFSAASAGQWEAIVTSFTGAPSTLTVDPNGTGSASAINSSSVALSFGSPTHAATSISLTICASLDRSGADSGRFFSATPSQYSFLSNFQTLEGSTGPGYQGTAYAVLSSPTTLSPSWSLSGVVTPLIAGVLTLSADPFPLAYVGPAVASANPVYRT